MDYKFNLQIIKGSKDIDITNDNVDVEVRLPNGELFTGTFFTFDNIQALLERYQETGECKKGLYFWSSNMIIVKQLTENVIQEAIEDLLKNEELERCLTKI